MFHAPLLFAALLLFRHWALADVYKRHAKSVEWQWNSKTWPAD
jgi:hypothetical protein